MSAKLKLTADPDRPAIIMTRTFNAPRTLVFEALTKPEHITQWLLGPPGWSMPVCDVDLRVGGAYRWVWRNVTTGREMGAGGIFREILPPERLSHTERFDEAWYPGEALVTTVLTETAGKTLFTATLLYESNDARDTVLRSPMESGVSASYDRLEAHLRTLS